MATMLSTRNSGDTLAQQALLEHQILQHITAALRLAMNWSIQSVGFAKKLSTVRFTAQSFQRHLHRILLLEEGGGYMQFVRDEQPGLLNEVRQLRAQHDEFRLSLTRILAEFKQLSGKLPDDQARFEACCDALTMLLDRLDAHHAAEIALIYDAMGDVGGEG